MSRVFLEVVQHPAVGHTCAPADRRHSRSRQGKAAAGRSSLSHSAAWWASNAVSSASENVFVHAPARPLLMWFFLIAAAKQTVRTWHLIKHRAPALLPPLVAPPSGQQEARPTRHTRQRRRWVVAEAAEARRTRGAGGVGSGWPRVVFRLTLSGGQLLGVLLRRRLLHRRECGLRKQIVLVNRGRIVCALAEAPRGPCHIRTWCVRVVQL